MQGPGCNSCRDGYGYVLVWSKGEDLRSRVLMGDIEGILATVIV